MRRELIKSDQAKYFLELIKSDLNALQELKTLLFTSMDKSDQAKHLLELMKQFVKMKQTVKMFWIFGLINEKEFLDSEKNIRKEVKGFFEEYKKNKYVFTPSWLEDIC